MRPSKATPGEPMHSSLLGGKHWEAEHHGHGESMEQEEEVQQQAQHVPSHLTHHAHYEEAASIGEDEDDVAGPLTEHKLPAGGPVTGKHHKQPSYANTRWPANDNYAHPCQHGCPVQGPRRNTTQQALGPLPDARINTSHHFMCTEDEDDDGCGQVEQQGMLTAARASRRRPVPARHHQQLPYAHTRWPATDDYADDPYQYQRGRPLPRPWHNTLGSPPNAYLNTSLPFSPDIASGYGVRLRQQQQQQWRELDAQAFSTQRQGMPGMRLPASTRSGLHPHNVQQRMGQEQLWDGNNDGQYEPPAGMQRGITEDASGVRTGPYVQTVSGGAVPYGPRSAQGSANARQHPNPGPAWASAGHRVTGPSGCGFSPVYHGVPQHMPLPEHYVQEYAVHPLQSGCLMAPGPHATWHQPQGMSTIGQTEYGGQVPGTVAAQSHRHPGSMQQPLPARGSMQQAAGPSMHYVTQPLRRSAEAAEHRGLPARSTTSLQQRGSASAQAAHHDALLEDTMHQDGGTDGVHESLVERGLPPFYYCDMRADDRAPQMTAAGGRAAGGERKRRNDAPGKGMVPQHSPEQGHGQRPKKRARAQQTSAAVQGSATDVLDQVPGSVDETPMSGSKPVQGAVVRQSKGKQCGDDLDATGVAHHDGHLCLRDISNTRQHTGVTVGRAGKMSNRATQTSGAAPPTLCSHETGAGNSLLKAPAGQPQGRGDIDDSAYSIVSIEGKQSLLAGDQQPNMGALASLPPELLERIINVTYYKTREALYRTCKGFQAALLARTTNQDGEKTSTRLELSTAGDPVVTSRALKLAARAAHKVSLSVTRAEPAEPAIQPAPSHTQCREHAWLDAMLQPWLSNAADAAAVFKPPPPPPLHQITRLQLYGMQLSHPFPTCIGEAFPHLQEYRLSRVQWPHNAVVGDVCWPQLQHLDVLHCATVQFLQAISPSNFPALTYFYVSPRVATVARMPRAEQEAVAACCRAFRKQLTEFVNIGRSVDVGEAGQLQRRFLGQRFPRLTFINISWCVRDSDFALLLGGCASLKHLVVWTLVLEEQHTAHHSLECVGFGGSIGNGVVTLSRLAIMPNLKRVSLPGEINMCCMVDAETVAHVLGRFGGCFRCGRDLTLVSDGEQVEASAIEANLERLLPLLLVQPAKHVVLKGATITAPLLAAVDALQMQRMVVEDCKWQPDLLRNFWALAPHIEHVEFSFECTPDSLHPCLDHITMLGWSAFRPVTLRIPRKAAAMQQCIQDALHDAGKEHIVTLKVGEDDFDV